MTGGGFQTRSLERIQRQEMEDILNDFDPIQAPPGPYKLQPEKKGDIIWLSGAPGTGKSTSGQILARTNGYVYYEADCFGALKNPYVPLDIDNPTMGQIYQKILKGPGMEERKVVIDKSMNEWNNLMQGKEFNQKVMGEFYHHLAMDVAREKKRIGGDFVIANFLMTADIRDVVRGVLGSELKMVILTLSTDARRERVLARHDGDPAAADLMDLVEGHMEAKKENEPNTVELEITRSMTKQEVVQEILKKIETMK